MTESPWKFHLGDVASIARTLPRKHFDALLSDPPYGLSFMGKKWDYRVPSPIAWSAVLQALKPGAPAIIFSSSRTYHRMTVAAEDGGFEVLDQLQWLYGQGMPKGLDISKGIDKKLGVAHLRRVTGKRKLPDTMKSRLGFAAMTSETGHAETKMVEMTAPASPEAEEWDGYNTQLKPAHEPALLAMRPLDGTYVENALKWGTGGLAISASRVGDEARLKLVSNQNVPRARSGWRTKDGIKKSPVGRAEGSSYERTDASVVFGGYPSNLVLDADAGVLLDEQARRPVARFFYSPKAGEEERNRGLDEPNDHPTVKPIELIRYFARLLLPPPRKDGSPRRILVPYSGSGSEVVGCLQAGWEAVVGIERDASHIAKAESRIRKGKIIQHAGRK